MWINNSFVQVRRQSVLDTRNRVCFGTARTTATKSATGNYKRRRFSREIVMQRHNYTVARKCFGDVEHEVQSGWLKMHENPFERLHGSLRPVYMFPDESKSTSSVSSLWSCIIMAVFCSASVMQERSCLIPAILIQSSRCRGCRISNLIHECRRGSVNGLPFLTWQAAVVLIIHSWLSFFISFLRWFLRTSATFTERR